MSENPTNRAKARFNAKTYTQVKVSVRPGTAAAFKEKCRENCVSMAGVLSRFMEEYSGTALECGAATAEDASTRKKRRKMIDDVIRTMTLIRTGEEKYKDNMPENLRNSVNFESSEESVARMDEIIEMLNDIY